MKQKTTIWLPIHLHEAIKQSGCKLSPLIVELLEQKFYEDNPFFIKSKLDEALQKRDATDIEINTLKEQLKKANEKQQQRQQQLKQLPYARKTYRRKIPKEGGENND
jgi:predicted nucleotide-binding protein (sugar kinase/HSP70/actin superfamily)